MTAVTIVTNSLTTARVRSGSKGTRRKSGRRGGVGEEGGGGGWKEGHTTRTTLVMGAVRGVGEGDGGC